MVLFTPNMYGVHQSAEFYSHTPYNQFQIPYHQFAPPMPPPGCHIPQGGLYSPHVPLYVQPHSSVPKPKCRFGKACCRQDCVFQHPEDENICNKMKKRSDQQKSSLNRVCLAFLTSSCRFGSECLYRHPNNTNEINRTKIFLSSIPCKYGEHCNSQYCLFYHQNDETVHEVTED